MTDDQDPQRLKTSGGTPAELVRALRALGRDDLDAARLARVAERLSTTVGSGTATGLLRTLTGTKTGLTGLLLGLGALGALGYALIANRAAPSVQAPAVPSVQVPAVPAPAPAPVAAGAPQEPAAAAPREAQPAEAATAPAPVQAQERPRPSHAPRRTHARPRDGRVRAKDSANSASVAAAPVETVANELQPAPANSPEPEQPRSHTEAKPPAEARAPKASTPSAKPLQVAERSETSLLHEARKIATRDPEAALRLLDEHGKRFPSGVLVPEREVLAIETLRRLGRDAEAERRLQRFEARYPRSIHLRRLERSGAGGAGKSD